MITLEKLAPFLPYELRLKKVAEPYTNSDVKIMTGLNSGVVMIDHNTYGWADFEDVKAICHPFSDLTKPIKVEGYNEGKEFVPLEEIRRINWNRMRDVGRLNDVTIDKYEITTGSLPHWIVQLMYRWNFAVNLEEDDYIDINTI